jgi:hypothetical protein
VTPLGSRAFHGKVHFCVCLTTSRIASRRFVDFLHVIGDLCVGADLRSRRTREVHAATAAARNRRAPGTMIYDRVAEKMMMPRSQARISKWSNIERALIDAICDGCDDDVLRK